MHEKMMNFNNKTEVQKHLPEDLLNKVTILLQDSGYVTIRPRDMSRYEWRQFNEKVKHMGGLWIFEASAHSHWSIPWSQ
jgi:hypothetical protein